jgi:ribosomal protein S10
VEVVMRRLFDKSVAETSAPGDKSERKFDNYEMRLHEKFVLTNHKNPQTLPDIANYLHTLRRGTPTRPHV